MYKVCQWQHAQLSWHYPLACDKLKIATNLQFGYMNNQKIKVVLHQINLAKSGLHSVITYTQQTSS